MDRLLPVLLGLAAFGWLLALTLLVRGYIRKRQRLLGDASIDQLEVLLSEVLERIDRLESGQRELGAHLADTHARVVGSLATPRVVRYNAFENIAASQSFTLALLDRRRSGLLLSSLVGREGGRMYVRPIEAGVSDGPLSDEESQTLHEALDALDREDAHPSDLPTP